MNTFSGYQLQTGGGGPDLFLKNCPKLSLVIFQFILKHRCGPEHAPNRGGGSRPVVQNCHAPVHTLFLIMFHLIFKKHASGPSRVKNAAGQAHLKNTSMVTNCS